MEKIILTNIVIDWQDDDLAFCFANLITKTEQGKFKIVRFIDGGYGSKAVGDRDIGDRDYVFALKAIVDK